MQTTQACPYDNWEFRHPGGSPMFYGSAKLARWYLKRGLARETGPRTVQFTFEPQGAGAMGDPAMLRPRENRCVVCGATDGLTKHHVIPRRCRQFFPESCKTHQSHDILVLCERDHRAFEDHCSAELDALLSGQSLLPPAPPPAPKSERKAVLRKWLGLLSALERPDVPAARKDEILQSQGWPADTAARDALGAMWRGELPAAAVPVPPVSFAYTEGQARAVERVCRAHFLATMQPRFLPEQWDPQYQRSR